MTRVLLAVLMLATAADARDVRCWRAAGGETRCDDGSRAHEFQGVTTIKRPGQRDTRCFRGPSGVSCSDR